MMPGLFEDPCANCPHPWHGLPCHDHIYITDTSPYAKTQCPCPGPFHQENQ